MTTVLSADPTTGVTLKLAVTGTPLTVADLTDGEAKQVAALPSESRRRTWLTARRALRCALSRAALPTDTSVYAFPNRRASLSYAGPLAVAVVLGSVTDPVRGVGVDIELREPPSLETADFFLTESEHDHLLSLPSTARPAMLLRQWTIKEALYKANPANDGTHLRSYALVDPTVRNGAAQLADAPHLDFQYLTAELPRGYLSVALALSRNGAHHLD